MRVALFAAGQLNDYERVRLMIGPIDQVICADGGLRHALALGLVPDLLVGDFDSANPEQIRGVAGLGVEIRRVPVEKDQTDTHLALNLALERGATEIMLLGTTGDRLDHTIANLLLLPGLPTRVQVTMIDDKNVIRLLRSGQQVRVGGAAGDLISLLPLSPVVEGVTITGVRWPLTKATLRWGISLGVSNQLDGDGAEVSVRQGTLLVISARD